MKVFSVFLMTLLALCVTIPLPTQAQKGSNPTKKNQLMKRASRTLGIDVEASSIQWLGEKVVSGSHRGSVKIQGGTLQLDPKMNVVGGTVRINMKSIKNTDLPQDKKGKLESHLKSMDFFHVSKHPEAVFNIVESQLLEKNKIKITGDLTLRGQTHRESFTLNIKQRTPFLLAQGDLSLSRSKYGVTYNSDPELLKSNGFFSKMAKKATQIAKDKIIKDGIQLSVTIQSEKTKNSKKSVL